MAPKEPSNEQQQARSRRRRDRAAPRETLAAALARRRQALHQGISWIARRCAEGIAPAAQKRGRRLTRRSRQDHPRRLSPGVARQRQRLVAEDVGTLPPAYRTPDRPTPWRDAVAEPSPGADHR